MTNLIEPNWLSKKSLPRKLRKACAAESQHRTLCRRGAGQKSQDETQLSAHVRRPPPVASAHMLDCRPDGATKAKRRAHNGGLAHDGTPRRASTSAMRIRMATQALERRLRRCLAQCRPEAWWDRLTRQIILSKVCGVLPPPCETLGFGHNAMGLMPTSRSRRHAMRALNATGGDDQTQQAATVKRRPHGHYVKLAQGRSCTEGTV